MMRAFVRVLLWCLFLIVPAILIALAEPRFIGGIAIEDTLNLATGIVAGYSPELPYRDAAAALRSAQPIDGDTQALRAEFLFAGSDKNASALSLATKVAKLALRHSPANLRAWNLICQIEAEDSLPLAANCLRKTYFIGRYDWYLVGPRLDLAARAWPYLDPTLRDEVVGSILPIWRADDVDSGASLRPRLVELLDEPHGSELLRAGFVSDPQALRDFNRFEILERMDAN